MLCAEMSLYSFLMICLALPATCQLTSFPTNLIVGKIHSDVTLTCHSEADAAVMWMFNNEPVESSEYRRVNGRRLTVSDLDVPSAGEYSCWVGKDKVNITHLLIEEEELDMDEEEMKELSCSAQTYSCFFTCELNLEKSDFTAARLRYRRNVQDSHSWADLTSTPAEQIFKFRVSVWDSPFAEENSPFVVTAEAIGPTHYIRRTEKFYIRDIVKPDPPQLHCTKHRTRLNCTVQPPNNWAKPLSYFPLAHQFEFVYRNDGRTEVSYSTHIPCGISRLRARSRDPLVPSQWSNWSSWENISSC